MPTVASRPSTPHAPARPKVRVSMLQIISGLGGRPAGDRGADQGSGTSVLPAWEGDPPRHQWRVYSTVHWRPTRMVLCFTGRRRRAPGGSGRSVGAERTISGSQRGEDAATSASLRWAGAFGFQANPASRPAGEHRTRTGSSLARPHVASRAEDAQGAHAIRGTRACEADDWRRHNRKSSVAGPIEDEALTGSCSWAGSRHVKLVEGFSAMPEDAVRRAARGAAVTE